MPARPRRPLFAASVPVNGLKKERFGVSRPPAVPVYATIAGAAPSAARAAIPPAPGGHVAGGWRSESENARSLTIFAEYFISSAA